LSAARSNRQNKNGSNEQRKKQMAFYFGNHKYSCRAEALDAAWLEYIEIYGNVGEVFANLTIDEIVLDFVDLMEPFVDEEIRPIVEAALYNLKFNY